MSTDNQDSNPFAATESHQPVATPQAAMSEETKKGLSGAKWALVIVGILTIALNAFMFANANNEVKELLTQEGDLGVEAPALVMMIRVVYGGAIAMGVLFIVLGLLVYRFPIFCTLVGLIVYLLSNAFFGLMDPSTLIRGVIIKIIIVVVLFKAVRAAFAYRQEQKDAYDNMFGMNPQQ